MNKLIVMTVAAGMLTLTACEKKNAPATNTTPTTTGSTGPSTPAGTPSMPNVNSDASKLTQMAGDAKDKLVAGVESGLASAKSKLDEWSTKVSAAAEDKKPEMQAALDKLKGSYNTLTSDLSDLKGKAGAEWDKAWANIKSSWASFETSMNDFTAKYKP